MCFRIRVRVRVGMCLRIRVGVCLRVRVRVGGCLRVRVRGRVCLRVRVRVRVCLRVRVRVFPKIRVRVEIYIRVLGSYTGLFFLLSGPHVNPACRHSRDFFWWSTTIPIPKWPNDASRGYTKGMYQHHQTNTTSGHIKSVPFFLPNATSSITNAAKSRWAGRGTIPSTTTTTTATTTATTTTTNGYGTKTPSTTTTTTRTTANRGA